MSGRICDNSIRQHDFGLKQRKQEEARNAYTEIIGEMAMRNIKKAIAKKMGTGPQILISFLIIIFLSGIVYATSFCIKFPSYILYIFSENYDYTGLYISILAISYSVIFLTTSLLSMLSGKDDTIYWYKMNDYILISPKIFNYYFFSVLGYISLVLETIAFVLHNSSVFWACFCTGIIAVILLYFKMISIRFRRDSYRRKLDRDIENGKEKPDYLQLESNTMLASEEHEFNVVNENLDLFFKQMKSLYTEDEVLLRLEHTWRELCEKDKMSIVRFVYYACDNYSSEMLEQLRFFVWNQNLKYDSAIGIWTDICSKLRMGLWLFSDIQEKQKRCLAVVEEKINTVSDESSIEIEGNNESFCEYRSKIVEIFSVLLKAEDKDTIIYLWKELVKISDPLVYTDNSEEKYLHSIWGVLADIFNKEDCLPWFVEKTLGLTRIAIYDKANSHPRNVVKAICLVSDQIQDLPHTVEKELIGRASSDEECWRIYCEKMEHAPHERKEYFLKCALNDRIESNSFLPELHPLETIQDELDNFWDDYGNQLQTTDEQELIKRSREQLIEYRSQVELIHRYVCIWNETDCSELMDIIKEKCDSINEQLDDFLRSLN